MNLKLNAKNYYQLLSQTELYTQAGKVTQSIGLGFQAYLPRAKIGSIYQLKANTLSSVKGVDAEVIGFKENQVFLMPFEEALDIRYQSYVTLKKLTPLPSWNASLLGRSFNGRGDPLDHQEPRLASQFQLFHKKSISPLDRKLIHQPLDLGIKAINGLLTCGKGQRIGIMAGSGVGKSILLGMIAQNTTADVNVIALIGERSREVKEFIKRHLGSKALSKSVVIACTADSSPLLKIRGAFLATSIAENFRDQGKDVLLLMDSVTRFCMAQREIGLSMGEPPASKGYTPSVFSMIPKLLERAGMGTQKGSITGIYTVLVEGDDLEDPIADSVRAILDGHIVLSRKIAQKNHFPAIDILQSTSRVMHAIVSPEHLKWASKIKDWLAHYQNSEDFIHMGAYVQGSDPHLDQALAVIDKIHTFLKQDIHEAYDLKATLNQMHSIMRHAEAHISKLNPQAKETSKIQF